MNAKTEKKDGVLEMLNIGTQYFVNKLLGGRKKLKHWPSNVKLSNKALKKLNHTNKKKSSSKTHGNFESKY